MNSLVEHPRGLPARRSQLPAQVPALTAHDLSWDSERLDLSRYWAVLYRRRWLIAAIVGGALLCGIVYTLMQTPMYRARATVQVSREAPRVMTSQDVEPAAAPDDEFAATQLALLRSRSLVERVVDRLKLANDDAFIGETRIGIEAAPDLTLGQARARAIGTVARNLSVAAVGGTSVFEIAYEDRDPVRASRIANAFAAEFIRGALDRRFDASNYARDFLRSRLSGTKNRLEQSERELVAYATRQGIVGITDANSGDGTSGTAQSLDSADLAGIGAARIQARAARIRAEEEWNVARSGGDALPQVLASPTIASLRSARATLASEYQQKLGLYTADFPEMRQMRARMAELDRQIAGEGGAIRRSIRANYLAALQQEQGLNRQVASTKSAVLDLQNRSIRYNILKREVDTNRQLYDGLLQRYKEIGVAGGVGASNITVVDGAAVPGSPASPILWLNLVITLAGGTLLALLVAFGLEAVDTSVKTPEDIEQELGLTLLGSIPLAKDVTISRTTADMRLNDMAEAYFSVASALQFVTPATRPLTLLLTSTRSGEGKSTSSVFLASAVAQSGKRVLLIDGDMRRPTLHEALGLRRRPGLSALLTGSASLAEVIQESQHVNLSAITAGELPPNAAQLLSLGAFRSVLDQAGEGFDIVIIDGPPVLGLADAPMMSAEADATVMVVESKGAGRRAVRRAIARLHQAQGVLVGAILTKFDARSAGYGYGEDYGSYYAYRPRQSADLPVAAEDARRRA